MSRNSSRKVTKKFKAKPAPKPQGYLEAVVEYGASNIRTMFFDAAVTLAQANLRIRRQMPNWTMKTFRFPNGSERKFARP